MVIGGNQGMMDDVDQMMSQMQTNLRERNVSVRVNRVLTKVENVYKIQKDLKVLVTSYPVKVADSCPLAIEQQRL